MKILVLTKRQYMGQDLFDDRFGRFWELPLELVRLGHEVQGLAFSYQRRPEKTPSGGGSGAVTWFPVNLWRGCIPQVAKYRRQALKIARDFRPDIIWTCSDAYHAIFGNWLAEHIQTACVIDLYDNFEAFSGSRLPGLSPLFRRAVRAAAGVTCFSRRLTDHVSQTYMRTKSTCVIENGVRGDIFRPQDPTASRQRFGLPLDAVLIGTAGALYRSRGIETFFTAYKQLSAQFKSLHLVLAGPRERRIKIPSGPRVHDLNQLPHAEVSSLYNSLDVAIICYRHSAQGEYSFPQKAYEIIACRVPVVAAAVGSMNELLQKYPECLYEAGDATSLAAAIQRQIQTKTIVETPVPSWADSAKLLSDFFFEIVDARSISANQNTKCSPH